MGVTKKSEIGTSNRPRCATLDDVETSDDSQQQFGTTWIAHAVDSVRILQKEQDPIRPHHASVVSEEAAIDVLDALADRLRDNYPFHAPRYAGQMLKPPHPIAAAAYTAAMQINPNNHALDGGPATAGLEVEVMAELAKMVGFDDSALAHLTSSGTIANLEALFVARESAPGQAIAIGSEAHYTHRRMCHLLGVETVEVPSDSGGRMDIAALDDVLRTGRIGTVVVTVGTTGLGAIDQVHEVLPLARSHGVRVHVDAAYGGFFTLLAFRTPPLLEPAPWVALREADSLVIDPHKHGLQPFGCGAVLFRDPEVARYYSHDSPYTYFSSSERHLGETSLECSRAGAAAAALWATVRVLPLEPESGLGEILAVCRGAAQDFDLAVANSELFTVYQPAELDIVTYWDHRARTTREVDAASTQLLHTAMSDRDPVFVSTLTVSATDFVRRHPEIAVDSEQVRVLRSVMMKPEHRSAVPWLVSRLEELSD